MNEIQTVELERDLCSPSQLDLRFHCPGSAQLQARLITSGHKEVSEVADRGIRLHAIMEAYGRDGTPVTSHNETGTDLEALLYCAETTDEIVKNVADQNPVQQFEVQIDLSELGISGGKDGCRVDRVILLPSIGCIGIDYKFGFKWVADPEFNLQFKAYAWGLHNKFGGDVQFIALQPVSDEDRQFLSHTFVEADFDQIGNEIRDIVNKAKSPEAALCRGRHCTKLFCRNKIACPLWTHAALSVPYPHTLASHILKCSPEERQNLLNEIKRAQSWCNSARSTFEKMAIDGEIEIRGYKIAPSEEWQWINEELAWDAAKTLLVSIGKTEKIPALYEPTRLKSRSAVQKLIGNSKAAKTFLDMNTKKVEIEGKFKLEAIEDDIESVKLKEIVP